jgi:hypothetical protein
LRILNIRKLFGVATGSARSLMQVQRAPYRARYASTLSR